MASRFQRSRTVTPPDVYTTADDSFNMHNNDILHSTAQMDGEEAYFPQQQHYNDQYQDKDGDSEHGSGDKSMSLMSIELGRGVKRSNRNGIANDDERSSNFQFSMGNDSQFEIVGTPPLPPRNAARKNDIDLRREASTRRALKTENRAISNPKQRSLSETLQSLAADDTTSAINRHNTRFIPRSRQTSANEPTLTTRSQTGTPRRAAVNNPTVQSATYTANSFMLPDLPNITELVSGMRKDGTPIFSRTSKPRPRFSSGGKPPLRPEHIPIEHVPTHEDELRIYASLQLLQNKIAQLEADKSEAQQQADEYQNEIIDLRSQLHAERRPDSALGSDDEQGARDKWCAEKTRFEASIKALRDRLDRTERKVTVSDISTKRVTTERDALVTQIGAAYFTQEELKAENEVFRENHTKLEEENEDLKLAMENLRKENEELRVQISQKLQDIRLRRQKQEADVAEEIRPAQETQERNTRKLPGLVRSKKETKTVENEDSATRRRSIGNGSAAQALQDDIDFQVAREVQRLRTEAVASVKARSSTTQPRSRSKSRQREQSAGAERRSAVPKRAVSAPVESDVSDAEPSTQFEITRQTRNWTKNTASQSQACARVAEENSPDITYLSLENTMEVANLRKKLEEERCDGRNISTPAFAVPRAQRDDTVRSTRQTTQTMPRKSSLKDITAGLDLGSGRFSINGETAGEMGKTAKTVRVQSPHTSDGSIHPPRASDAGDTSMLSNTSRRRRAVTADNMTSAFIIPDITIRPGQAYPTLSGKSCIQHNAASCTACHPNDENITIPTPVPVTDRVLPEDPDITSATIRPSQPPSHALALVIKQLEDEIKHLKIQLAVRQTLYNQHTPALAKRGRVSVKAKMDFLTSEIEKRSNQVYALHDVLEGQKQAAELADQHGEKPKEMGESEMEDTLMSIGIDPAEISGRVGRQDDGAEEWSGEESEELPWEGLSDYDSEGEKEEVGVREKRRSDVH